MIYNPPETTFLQEAKEANLEFAGGLSMLFIKHYNHCTFGLVKIFVKKLCLPGQTMVCWK